MARWACVLGGSVVALVLALLLLVREWDLTSQQDRLAAYVTSRSGRRFEIRGGLRLGLSLRPELVARDVHLANAPWGTRPEMLAIERADLVLALWPLLRGRVHVVRVQLSGVRLLLESDGPSRENWRFETASPGAAREPAGAGEPELWVHRLDVEELALEWREGRRAEPRTLRIAQLAVASEAPSQPLELALQGSFGGREFAIQGRAGSLEQWLSTQPVPLDLQVRAGSSTLDVEGELASRQPLRLHARLRSQSIDLDPWLPPAAAQGAAASGGGEARLFPSEPLGLALPAGAANLQLDLARLSARALRLEDAQAGFALDARKLRVEPLEAVFQGSRVRGHLDLDVSGPTPRLGLSLLAQQLDLGDLLAKLELSDRVAASIEIAVNLRGSGDSLAALLGSLDGHVSVAVNGGELPTRYVDFANTDLAAKLMSWRRPPEQTQIECGVIQLQIEKGVAHSQLLLFDTKHMTLWGKGDVDLRNETLRLQLAPRPHDPRLLKLSTDVQVSGSLKAPQARSHPMGLFKSAVRFVFGPARMLVPFDLLGGTRHHACVERVRAVDPEPPGPS